MKRRRRVGVSGRPRSRPGRPRPSKKRRSPSPSRQHAAVERARRDLDRALTVLSVRVGALTGVVDDIAAAAVEGEREALARDLAGERLLRDIAELRDALAAAPPGSLEGGLEVLRTLPDALMAWLGRRLSLVPYFTRGEELEVPADRLAAFELTEPPAEVKGLVRLRVLSRGWKRGGRLVARPQAEVVRS